MKDQLLLGELLGETILGCRRLKYVHQGSVDDAGGNCEISFSPTRSLVLGVGLAGVELVVEPGPWLDPFAEPLTPGNRTWVEQYGKWQAFDVSDEIPFKYFIGRRVDQVVACVDENFTRGDGWSRTLRSVRLSAGQRELVVLADFDEIEVKADPAELVGPS